MKSLAEILQASYTDLSSVSKEELALGLQAYRTLYNRIAHVDHGQVHQPVVSRAVSEERVALALPPARFLGVPEPKVRNKQAKDKDDSQESNLDDEE